MDEKNKEVEDTFASKRKRLEKLSEEARKIYNDFQSCQTYKDSKGITQGARRSVDFYEGRQWVDTKTKAPIERPMVNVIQNVIDSKEANILAKTYALNFILDNDNYSTENVTKFARFQMKEMGQEELNRCGVHDGLIKGTFIWAFIWDEDANGRLGVKNGAVRAVNIDIADFAVSNPNERDIQKQDYIIWRSRESVASVKAICDTLSEEEMDELIENDGFEPRYNKDIEQDNEKMVYVYTKLFKQDGEVYFTKSTKDVVIQKAICLNPNVVAEAIKKERKKKTEENQDGIYEMDHQLRNSLDETTTTSIEEEYQEKYKANLYPVVIDSFIKRDNSIFGLSFVEQMIPMQKIINQLITSNTLSCMKSSMPTLVVKEGALGTQKIDLSKPGGVLIDKSGVGVNGISVLNTGSIATTQFTMAQEMISMMKDNARASDVLDDGRNISGATSGYAISQLMTIQEKPVAQWQEVLARCIEREGLILEMYYKLYYQKVQFSATYSDGEIAMQRKNNPDIDPMTLTRHQTAEFNGEDYINSPFNIAVEVGESAKFSELAVTQALDSLILNGTIEKLSPNSLKIWTKLIPSYYFPESKKREFEILLDEKENGIIAQLQQQLQQAQGLLERAQLQNQTMQQEYTNKVNVYNSKLKEAQEMVKMLTPNAQNNTNQTM